MGKHEPRPAEDLLQLVLVGALVDENAPVQCPRFNVYDVVLLAYNHALPPLSLAPDAVARRDVPTLAL